MRTLLFSGWPNVTNRQQRAQRGREKLSSRGMRGEEKRRAKGHSLRRELVASGSFGLGVLFYCSVY